MFILYEEQTMNLDRRSLVCFMVVLTLLAFTGCGGNKRIVRVSREDRLLLQSSNSYSGKPIDSIAPNLSDAASSVAVHVIQRNDNNIELVSVQGDIDAGGVVTRVVESGALGLLFFGPKRSSRDTAYKEQVNKLEKAFGKSSHDYLLETAEKEITFPQNVKVTYDFIDLRTRRENYGNSAATHVNLILSHVIFGPKGMWSDQDLKIFTNLNVIIITDENTQHLFIDSLLREDKNWLYQCGNKLLSEQYLGTAKASSNKFRKGELVDKEGQLLKEQLQVTTRDAVGQVVRSLNGQGDNNKVRFRCIP